MANTLITFHGKYWEYGGADVDRKGLTIGGFESAGFADLVAAYILENTRDLFDNAIYDGIYRDDGFKVDIGKQTTEEICEWLSRFQSRVNELTGSDCLQFTVDIWNPDAPADEVPSNKKVTICKDEAFPYLDLEMYWRGEELKFRVHMKPNQVLKYLNKGSAHTNACFRAIPYGVLRRLTILTSLTPETENMTLDQLYPEHIKGLEKAKLPLPKEYPTLMESYAMLAAKEQEKADSRRDLSPEELQKKEHQKKRDQARTTYFCAGFTKIWPKPISVILRELTKKHKLPWLRPKMSHHKFTNLGEMFNGDLTSKVKMNIADEELKDKPCNCNKKTMTSEGVCQYNGNCRISMIVYGLGCEITGATYVGKSQDYLKKRTSDHFYDTWKLREAQMKGKTYAKTDAFAKHFVQFCQDCTTSNQVRGRLKEIVKPTIIYSGDRIRCMKSSRTLQCQICMMERKEILHRLREDKSKVINDNSDIYSSCKCGSRFHKFTDTRTITSTLRTRMTQKKVPSARKSKQIRHRRKSRQITPITPSAQVSTPSSRVITPESAYPTTTPRLIDTNVPGLPYRSPSLNPTNLHLAQYAQYQTYLEGSILEV